MFGQRVAGIGWNAEGDIAVIVCDIGLNCDDFICQSILRERLDG